jgi:hypothetical protein
MSLTAAACGWTLGSVRQQLIPAIFAGVAVVAPVLTVVIGMLGGARSLPSKASMQTAAAWGIAAGIVWNLGRSSMSNWTYCLGTLHCFSCADVTQSVHMQAISCQFWLPIVLELPSLTHCSNLDCWWLACGASCCSMSWRSRALRRTCSVAWHWSWAQHFWHWLSERSTRQLVQTNAVHTI